MKVLIVTVAGMSSRFSKSVGTPTIKCIYHKKSIKESLLYTMLSQSGCFDKFIIVGGYKYAELKQVIDENFGEFSEKIIMAENLHYEDYGSGYSLYIGLQKAIEVGADDIVFAEGDLFLDREDYIAVCNSQKSIITINQEPILARKAVALYVDEYEVIHYIYDTSHKALIIDEPFLAIYNSGQVWKFADKNIVRKVYESITDREWQGTNLVFVEKYFQSISRNDYGFMTFRKWINCNTIDDFNMI